MSTAQVSADSATETPSAGTVDMKLEVVTVPVSDVDRAKSFYESLGWRLDIDLVVATTFVTCSSRRLIRSARSTSARA